MSDFIISNPIISGSFIWSIVQKVKGMIVRGIRIKVGNDRSIRFWEDNWFVERTLFLFQEYCGCINICKKRFKILVIEYWNS